MRKEGKIIGGMALIFIGAILLMLDLKFIDIACMSIGGMVLFSSLNEK